MPEHNLEPPKFSRKALERILSDWTAVKSMLFTGAKEASTAYVVVWCGVVWCGVVSHSVVWHGVACAGGLEKAWFHDVDFLEVL